MPGDPGLTAPGRKRAAVTARWFRRAGLTAVYSSPLRRARETAEPIAAAAGLAVRVDDRLRERVNWEAGEPFDRFQVDWDRSTRDRDFVLGNGESSRSAGERLLGFVAGLARRSGPVAAVSHGGVTTDLLRTLAGDAALPPRLLDHGIPNAGGRVPALNSGTNEARNPAHLGLGFVLRVLLYDGIMPCANDRIWLLVPRS